MIIPPRKGNFLFDCHWGMAFIITPWLDIRRKKFAAFFCNLWTLLLVLRAMDIEKRSSISIWHSILGSCYHVVTHRLFIVVIPVFFHQSFLCLSPHFSENTGFSIAALCRWKESLLPCNLFLFLLLHMALSLFTTDHQHGVSPYFCSIIGL